MSDINYINKNTITITRNENYGYSTHDIEYDTNILKLISKIYTSHQEEGTPPKVEYTFLILQNKATKIKFTECHDSYGELVEYVYVNNKSKCIIS